MADEERPETIDETFERVEARARGEREKRRERLPEPPARGVPLSASPEIRAAVATALQHPAPPLTDEGLLAVLALVRSAIEEDGWPGDEGRSALDRLEAEVRRLRSDAGPPDQATPGEMSAMFKLVVNQKAEAEKELRRLRSDEWLDSARAEIGAPGIGPSIAALDRVFEILRKHRDGKA